MTDEQLQAEFRDIFLRAMREILEAEAELATVTAHAVAETTYRARWGELGLVHALEGGFHVDVPAAGQAGEPAKH